MPKVKVLLKFSNVLIRIDFHHTFASVIKTTTTKSNIMKAVKKNQFEDLVRANVNKGVAKKDKKDGVIQTMINILSKKAYTKDSLLDELCSMFPEREESALKSTIKAQFAGKTQSRLEKERGIEFKRSITKAGFVTFKIKGFKDWSLEEENEEEN